MRGIARILAAALLVPGVATAEVDISGPADALSFTLTNRTHVLTGEIASPRGKRERLLIDLTAVTRETLGEKGIVGTVGIVGRAAERDMPLLYSVRVPGRAAALDELGLVTVDLDDCCALHRSFHDPATGERLFETTVPTASLTLEGPTYKRRVAAFVARMDGREDHRLWGDTAIGLITYAAADRTIRQIVVKADTEENARRLRSLDDERTALAWVDGGSGAPIVTVPEQGSVQPALRLHFITSDIEVTIPLQDDDLVPDESPAGLTLAAQPEPAIAGGWRIASAVAAPWASGAPAQELKDRYVLFGNAAVRSAGSVFDCRHATYERSAVPPEGLFLGAGLTAAQAAALGLDPPMSPSFTLTCDTGVFTFHRTPDDRWLVAVNNVIYGLERAVE